MGDIRLDNVRNNGRFVVYEINSSEVAIMDVIDNNIYRYTMDEFKEYARYFMLPRLLGIGNDISLRDMLYMIKASKPLRALRLDVHNLKGSLSLGSIVSMYGHCIVNIDGCTNGRLLIPSYFVNTDISDYNEIKLSDINGLELIGKCEDIIIYFNFYSMISNISFDRLEQNGEFNVILYGDDSMGKSEWNLDCQLEACDFDIECPMTVTELNRVMNNFYVYHAFTVTLTSYDGELDLNFLHYRLYYFHIKFVGSAMKRFLEGGTVIYIDEGFEDIIDFLQIEKSEGAGEDSILLKYDCDTPNSASDFDISYYVEIA